MCLRSAAGAVVFGGATTLSATAGVTITAEQIGDDVVFAGGGTLDVSLWTYLDSFQVSPQVTEVSVVLGPIDGGDADIYESPVNFAGPRTFPIDPFQRPDIGSGDVIGIQLQPRLLAVPFGYASGDPIAASITFKNETFASMGLIEGEYTWTWDTLDGRGEFFTVNVIVPAPAASAFLGLAAVTVRRHRRNSSGALRECHTLKICSAIT